MAEDKRRAAATPQAAPNPANARKPESRMTGSLRDALAAVRGDTRPGDTDTAADARRIIDAAGAAQATPPGEATQIIRAALKPEVQPPLPRQLDLSSDFPVETCSTRLL